MAIVTLDPGNKHPSITLSNGDLTAATIIINENREVFGTESRSSGKWYVEVTKDVAVSINHFIGVVSDAHSPSTYINDGALHADTVYYAANVGSIVRSGATVIEVFNASDALNDVYGMLLDLDGLQVAFIDSNGNQSAFHSLNVGSYRPFVQINRCTASYNFGASAFVHSVPLGYEAWDTPSGITANLDVNCNGFSQNNLACSLTPDVIIDLDCNGFNQTILDCGNAVELPCEDFTTDLSSVSASLVITPTQPCLPYTIEVLPSSIDIGDPYQIVIHTMGEATITSPHGDFVLREDIVHDSPDPLVQEVLNFSGGSTLTTANLVRELAFADVQTPIVADGVILQDAGAAFSGISVVNNSLVYDFGEAVCGSVLVYYHAVNEIRYTYSSKTQAGEYGYLVKLDCGVDIPVCVSVGLN